jgi:hypothetical protein
MPRYRSRHRPATSHDGTKRHGILLVTAALLTSAIVVAAILAVAHRPASQSAGPAASSRRLAGKSVKPTLAGNVKDASGAGKHNGHADAASGPAPCGKPVFIENFSGDTFDSNEWKIYNDPYGSPPSMTPRTVSSVTVAGGNLDLTGHYQAPYGYVSGGLASTVNQTYGCWEVRFRADDGAGYEPVVLLWPEGARADGEIDMAEVYPGSVKPVSTNRLGAGEFLHIGPDDKFIGGRKIPFSVNFAQWQTVAVDWLPNRITMYLNGVPTWTVGTDYMGMDYIPDTPFHLAIQMDEGCTRHRCSPNSSTPSQVVMQVAWVKIYAAP